MLAKIVRPVLTGYIIIGRFGCKRIYGGGFRHAPVMGTVSPEWGMSDAGCGQKTPAVEEEAHENGNLLLPAADGKGLQTDGKSRMSKEKG